MATIERFSQAFIADYNSRYMSPTDTLLYVHIGHFFMWFAAAEVIITQALAFTLGFKDLSRVNYLIRGMDATVKCERLRKSSAVYLPMGTELSGELKQYEEVCIPTRNKLAHSWPVINKETNYVHYFGSGYKHDPLSKNHPKVFTKHDGIHLDDLMSRAMWLNAFTSNVDSALEQAIDGGAFEISQKRLLKRQEVRQQSQDNRPSKPDKQTPKPPQSGGG